MLGRLLASSVSKTKYACPTCRDDLIRRLGMPARKLSRTPQFEAGPALHMPMPRRCLGPRGNLAPTHHWFVTGRHPTATFSAPPARSDPPVGSVAIEVGDVQVTRKFASFEPNPPLRVASSFPWGPPRLDMLWHLLHPAYGTAHHGG